MVDNLDQTERVDRELNVVKRARFNQTIETHKTNEVPEPKFGVEPHTVKDLPALPVRERQQDNMLLHQQLQDNMLEEEVVSFGQRAQQQQQDQQQLQLRQHNIPHNPVNPKQLQAMLIWSATDQCIRLCLFCGAVLSLGLLGHVSTTHSSEVSKWQSRNATNLLPTSWRSKDMFNLMCAV